MHKKLSNIFRIVIFLPLFSYLGERSFIAYDEGFYILQAKWILAKGNWIAPMWFDNISLDRTIGIQFLIALSQKFLGSSDFVIYIPTTICAIYMAYLTYQIHKELIGESYALISPLILSTTLLWINHANMATQDIVFSTIVTLGIYSTIKASKSSENIFLIFSGIWIGLAIMFKTFLTIIPILGILPFLIYKKIAQKRSFLLGLFIGLIPFLVWSFLIIKNYGYSTYDDLFSKLLSLSKNNTFTNPFYYYLWNIPINTFPWSLFLLMGLAESSKLRNQTSKYFLFIYPLIVIGLLSIFSTKTQYYPLQITAIFSVNCYLGISLIIKHKSSLINIVRFINFIFVPITLLTLLILVNFNYLPIDIELSEKQYITIGVLLFSICWLSYNFLKTNKAKLLCIILGPYFLFSTVLQSGLITDRSKDLRIATEDIIRSEKLNNIAIHTVITDIDNELAQSKIIKILALMPRLGDGISSLNDLDLKEYAWTTISKEEIIDENQLKIINQSKTFSPWNLVKKER